ncbi:TonB-dependent siderophore receptor [Pandoraea fibrosis]|uniref:TonB-dependent siderophore receptor n=1 Tax=Pandoraea fibrosis TaxID=1891094 RepID=A0ABX6HRT4_9BURK|nr:TonB-dependent receptor [Pandoraea fibrosis]QHE92811.1 TonB-dependent siderophore receptor [Pandoraea fibrosis]QHF13632.1 TonB-dependent siderophore receptor [Pandoraea fibrosis]
MKTFFPVRTAVAVAISLLCAFAHAADNNGGAAQSVELPATQVQAASVTSLDEPVQTGSRLGLSIKETPASVEIIDRRQLVERGDANIVDAVSRATGINASPHPGNGGSELGARGFVGNASVTQLYDGVRPYGAIGVTFPFDTWSVERIEVLRGPASVIYGEGAIGGVVNIVPRKPEQAPVDNEIQLGIGTEKTGRIAFGSGGAINDKLSYRFDASANRSGNWVDRGDSRNASFSAAVKYDVTPRFSVTASLAEGNQHPMQYFGVPLVGGRLDPATYKKNYNVEDALITYRDSWATLAAAWRPTDDLTITSTLYHMKSKRHWKDAEYYTYLPSSGLVQRSSYTEILHDQAQIGNVTSATLKGHVFGMENTASAGVEFNHTTFQHTNNSPYSGTSLVDLYNPTPGGFINVAGTYPKYRSQANQYAFFAEDRLKVTSRWSVVGGVRYDHASIHRDDLITGAAFSKDLGYTGWRVGTVYDVTAHTSVYGQYSVAADPVSSLLMLTASKAKFDLATGKQIELGVKQDWLDGRVDGTLSVYRIVKNNLLSVDPLNPSQSLQVGQQSSRGVELTLGAQLSRDVRVDLNGTLLRAKYDAFDESVGGVSVSRAGNIPVNVPQQMANLWMSWRVAQAWTASGGLKYVGKRYADTANTLALPSYTTVDLALAWKPRRDLTLTGRVYNVFNRHYVQTAYYNSTQWLLGNDRRAELVMSYRF